MQACNLSLKQITWWLVNNSFEDELLFIDQVSENCSVSFTKWSLFQLQKSYLIKIEAFKIDYWITVSLHTPHRAPPTSPTVIWFTKEQNHLGNDLPMILPIRLKPSYIILVRIDHDWWYLLFHLILPVKCSSVHCLCGHFLTFSQKIKICSIKKQK